MEKITIRFLNGFDQFKAGMIEQILKEKFGKARVVESIIFGEVIIYSNESPETILSAVNSMGLSQARIRTEKINVPVPKW